MAGVWLQLTELLACWRIDAPMFQNPKRIFPVLLLISLLQVAGAKPATLPLSSAGQTASQRTSSGPRKFRVSQGVAESHIIKKVPPHYPSEAKKGHIIGDVILDFMIDRNGGVKDLVIVSGNPVLARAAVEAVQQWKNKPYLLNGDPVEVETTTKITFRM
jgi:TonB family protein